METGAVFILTARLWVDHKQTIGHFDMGFSLPSKNWMGYQAGYRSTQGGTSRGQPGMAWAQMPFSSLNSMRSTSNRRWPEGTIFAAGTGLR